MVHQEPMETPGKHVSRSRLTAFVSRPQAFGKSGMRLIVCSQAAVTQPATRNMNIPSSLQSCSSQSNNKLGLCCLILCTSTCWRGYHHMTKGRQVVNIPAAWHKQVSTNCVPYPAVVHGLLFCPQTTFHLSDLGSRLQEDAWHLHSMV